MTSTASLSIADTPLGKPEVSHLLEGLDVYQVPALDDSHPLTVFGINSEDVAREQDHSSCRRPILLLHGRTWSSVPVYHLLGGSKHKRSEGTESRSLMEAFYETGDLQPYAMDFRGFGGTPKDSTGTVRPHLCVGDVESVLSWIAKRHGFIPEEPNESSVSSSDGVRESSDMEYSLKSDRPALLGWSQGALIAQLAAQKSPQLLSKLVLYGSIYDPMIRYPRAPLYVTDANLRSRVDGDPTPNTYDAAIEDFTIEGTIAPEPARQFAEAALMSDPYKARWTMLHEFNNIDPARVHVPTLLVAGDHDPYCPLRVQQELFVNLGRGADRCWSILSDADHAVHLLDGRDRFVTTVRNFVEHGRMGAHKF